jgi:RNA polymerase sigma-70 factor (ECF subfamily)
MADDHHPSGPGTRAAGDAAGGYPDEQLMQRIARNDTAAFDALFRRHLRAVFSFTLRMVGDATAAEDLTQECFLRVWRARDRYQPAAAFRTWLFTIARRLALDELKRRETHPAQLAAETLDDADFAGTVESLAGEEPASPQEIVMARELGRALDQALRGLPKELRETVLLRDVEGLSYDEIAAVLGCPIGTVKSRLNAARKRLQSVALDWMGERRT